MVNQPQNSRAVPAGCFLHRMSTSEAEGKQNRAAAVNDPVTIVRQGEIAHLCKFAPKKVLRASKAAVNDSRQADPLCATSVDKGQMTSPMAGAAVEDGKEDFKVLGYLPEVQSGEHMSGVCCFDERFLVFMAGLGSAIIHDHGRRLSQRDEVIEAISVTLGTLEQISHSTKTAAICYSVLSKLVNKLSFTPEEELILHSKSADSPLTGLKTPSSDVPGIDFGRNNNRQPLDAHNPEMYVSTMSGYSSLEPLAPASLDLQELSNVDLAELSQIWDLENLGLDFSQALTA